MAPNGITVPVLAGGSVVLVLLILIPALFYNRQSACVCYRNEDIEIVRNRSDRNEVQVAEIVRNSSDRNEVQVAAHDPIGPSDEDIKWVKSQLDKNHLGEPPNTPQEWHELRKGINPRTRERQLEDLRKYKGISHYEEHPHNNHTALPCPGELLVEQHHSNYGEPWAGGRDVYEFLAKAVGLKPHNQVLEVGCGTLRVGLHFIRYLKPAHFHCLERDVLSLMAAFRYELPAQGLIHKRPLIVRDENMDFSKLEWHGTYDLIYASAVFLHMPDALVWTGLERLAPRLNPINGRLFASHNIKFCTRLHGDECFKRLSKLGLKYVGKHTHDSLLFNHYEVWFEFQRNKS